MLDRESTFAEPEIVLLLKSHFIPVAIDQAYQRRQQDTEGEFYRKIAGQGPRNDFAGTTQGFYIASPDGELLSYNNNRDPAKLLRLMKKALVEFTTNQRASGETLQPIEPLETDPRFNIEPPEGGLVVRVHAKVLGGYKPTDSRWRRIFQTALSRDNLWITKQEQAALVAGELPESLQLRMARFHLVDNTRGEPSMWKPNAIKSKELKLNDGKLEGNVQLLNRAGDRGFETQLKGLIESRGNRVVRFDIVALGEFWGEGRYTPGAPE